MSQVLSGLFTTAALGAMGFACGALALAWSPEEAAEFVPPNRAPAVEPVVVAAREVPDDWPTVFGTVPDVVVAAPEPEPEIVAPAAPEQNNTYLLTGVIAGPGIDSFAMLSENDRGVVVRVGDILVGGETVIAIDQTGVLIEFDGVQELIPVPERDFAALVQFAQPQTTPSRTVANEVKILLEDTSRNGLEELMTSAGRLEPVERDDQPAITIVSIRDGHLFDQMGLRAGDTILGVNGTAPEGLTFFANTPDTDLLRGALEIEILRDGARQTVKVILDQS